MDPSFFNTGTNALAHGLSHSSTTSSSCHLFNCSLRSCLCLGLMGRTLVLYGFEPGSRSISNSTRSVFPKASSGELKISMYSLTSSFTFLFISGSSFKSSFSSKRSSLMTSSTLSSSSLALLTFSSGAFLRTCRAGVISAICIPALSTCSPFRLRTAIFF